VPIIIYLSYHGLLLNNNGGGLRLHKLPEYQQYNGQGGKAGYGVNPKWQDFGAGEPGFLPGFRGGSITTGRATVFEEGIFAGEVAFRTAYRRECPAATGAVFRV
jgi:hypothetical protein